MAFGGFSRRLGVRAHRRLIRATLPYNLCMRRSLGVLVVSTAVIGLMLTGCRSTTPSATRTTSAAPSMPITADGRLLWNLEALLRTTFGKNQPSGADNTDSGPTNPSNPPKNSATGTYVNFDCAGDSCSPLSIYHPYWYTFANPTDSAFHLSARNYRDWFFGNYRVPILIKGKIVACNSRESRFLIRYSDASSFTLACMAPESRG